MSSIELGAVEARILGCLLEKQRTTPDAYPLSLNALRLACNQSTNRDPVVDYDETELRDGLHRLERRGLVRLASGAGSRAMKYRHLLAQALPLDDGEQALVCVLLLRGPQTPGELKQRTERIYAFASLADVHAALDRLIERDLAARHPRRPGQKEDRYSHLLGAEEDAPAAVAVGAVGSMSDASAMNAAGAGAEAVRDETAGAEAPRGENHAGGLDAETPDGVAELARRVARLERELEELRASVAATGARGDSEAARVG
jgi:uncharacterized protein